MIDNSIFIFGMIRSGTTLLSKILSANRSIKIPSDPYMQFFKSFRNEFFIDQGVSKFPINCPLGEEIQKKYIEINKKISNSNFDLNIKHISLDDIKKLICKQAERDAAEIIPYVKEIKSNNYSDLLDKLMNIILESYGSSETKIYGFKSTFSEQFAQPLLNKYKNAKCIFIIRDPRAIYASHINEHEEQYPLLFIIKQWRKSIIYALKLMSINERILIVKYEDLVSNKIKKIKEICNFLNTDFDTEMLEENNFKDGTGNMWSRNTSYDDLNIKNDIWKEKLDKEIISFIEYFTQYELNYFNYETFTDVKSFNQKNNYSIETREDIYLWMREYFQTYELNKAVLSKELDRIENMKLNENKIDDVNNLMSHFLYTDQFDLKEQKY